MPPTLPISIILAVLVLTSSADASWLLDERRWHVSAHGQASCRDCHAGFESDSLHPNPTTVNSDLGDFFRLDQCTACHDGIMDEIEQGLHANTTLQAGADYRECLRCHDPHYQLHVTNPPGEFDVSLPPGRQCAVCHEPRDRLPELSEEDEACMSCHRRLDPQDARTAGKIASFCFFCHAADGGLAASARPQSLPILDNRVYPASPHSRLSCLVCHLQAAQFRHSDQSLSDCRQCHRRHDEKVAHDAHLRVACEACHLRQIVAKKEETIGTIGWSVVRKSDHASRLHHMASEKTDSFCRRCHFSGNTLGAAAAILPPKSILCMPCHAATFSLSDGTTMLALIVFAIGIAASFSFWLSGAVPGRADAGVFVKTAHLIGQVLKTIFSAKIAAIVEALVFDVLLQRRLYRQSKTRWLIHGLIFYPFVFRFSWGLVALLASLWYPQGIVAWSMLDRNHPWTAFLFDLSGVIVVLGVIMAVFRAVGRRSQKMPSLPHHDFLALGLMTAILAVGFALEALRIAMTGNPPGSEYAFLGSLISRFFQDAKNLVDIYVYVWYSHAILTGVFVAYLPFSRMFHILLAPVVASMQAVAGHAGER